MSISQVSFEEKKTWFELKRGILDCAPILIGIVPFALVLGAQAAQKGLSPLEVPLMTGLNFAGGSEFAAIELWTSPPHIALIVAVTFLVNSRHLLMGGALAPLLRHLPKWQVYPLLFVMVDETWALGIADAKRREAQGLQPAFSTPYYVGAAIVFYLNWVTFTGVGGVLGPMLGDVHAYGFDMAFPAVFLVLMKGMWKGLGAAGPWAVSLVVGALTYLFVPGAWYVPAGAVAGMAWAYFLSGDA
ncbi:branched-chain amino acid ABC transporter permease [Ensifer sp. Root31]|uniref:AzlC family ABC transporter permease n=1 Tax=Ensifer sp. Root31 TaxID=1736512 RepID=UPI00070BCBB5|nr:AzlC family ABC transporter permease [Ensifer sp. Root31]KQU86332.1 branched-chain amino acid ABC transporter permease [Ensifer sp. Root31]